MRRPAWTFLLLLHLNCSISNCARNGTQTRDDRKSLLSFDDNLIGRHACIWYFFTFWNINIICHKLCVALLFTFISSQLFSSSAWLVHFTFIPLFSFKFLSVFTFTFFKFLQRKFCAGQFSLFSIVQFPNLRCTSSTSSTTYGTCITRSWKLPSCSTTTTTMKPCWWLRRPQWRKQRPQWWVWQ